MISALPLMLVLSVATSQYVRSETGAREENGFESHCLHWDQPQIVWHQSTRGYDGNDDTFDPDAEYAAVRRSFETWNQVAAGCGNFVLAEGQPLPNRRIGFDAESTANTNLILFRRSLCADTVPLDDPCRDPLPGGERPVGVCGNEFDCWDDLYGEDTIAITTVSFDVTSGQILDADMEFNQASFTFTTVDGPSCPITQEPSHSCVSTDLENTMTHEVGHLLGLDHTSDSDSTMYRSAARGELSKRSLDGDSANFICEVYPRGFPSRDCMLIQASSTLGAELSPLGCSATGLGPSMAAVAGLLSLLWFRRRERR